MGAGVVATSRLLPLWCEKELVQGLLGSHPHFFEFYAHLSLCGQP